MNKFRIALAAMIVALAAVSAIDSASAFPHRFWHAVTFYYVPL
jgi:hypothetical protein